MSHGWNKSSEDFMTSVQFPWIMTADGVHPPQNNVNYAHYETPTAVSEHFYGPTFALHLPPQQDFNYHLVLLSARVR